MSQSLILLIKRWRTLNLDCKDRLTELSAVAMCTQGILWGLCTSGRDKKPHTFEELATRAHDMKLSIANTMIYWFQKVEKKKKRSEEHLGEVSMGATKEVMVLSTTPLKFDGKEKKIEKSQMKEKKDTEH